MCWADGTQSDLSGQRGSSIDLMEVSFLDSSSSKLLQVFRPYALSSEEARRVKLWNSLCFEPYADCSLCDELFASFDVDEWLSDLLYLLHRQKL